VPERYVKSNNRRRRAFHHPSEGNGIKDPRRGREGAAARVSAFQTLRDETLRELEPIQQTAAAIGTLDVVCALAETAVFSVIPPR